MGGGKRKIDLRSIGKLNPSGQEVTKVLGLLSLEQHPIVIAIVAAGLIERNIELLIRSKLPKMSDEAWFGMTDEPGALGTLSRKIALGRALNLYDDVIEHNLNVIRIVRNGFAHAKIALDFSNEHVVKELRSIRLPDKRQRKLFKALQECNKTLDPQHKFFRLFIAVTDVLMARRERSLRGRELSLYKRQKKLDAALAARTLILGEGVMPGDSSQSLTKGLMQGSPPTGTDDPSSPRKK